MMKPNILIMVVDQMNFDAISKYRSILQDPAYGCHWVETPNLDRLIDHGVSFLETSTPNPVCCPGRSCLFTGRMSIETGVTYNNVGIAENVMNMGQWFEQQSDYDRVYCGKWHAGGAWNCPEVSGARKIPGFDTLPVGTWGGGDFLDYQVSASAEAYIRNHQEDHSFLLVASMLNPHDICYWTPMLWGGTVVPQTDVFALGEERPPLPPNFRYDFKEPERLARTGKHADKLNEQQWRNYIYDYYRMVEKLDGDVGRMLDAVESRSDETLVVFVSDHGEGIGRHGRYQKWHPYDESLKVPLIVSLYGGQAARGIIDTDHLVNGVDIMSTVCAYAGIEAPPHARGLSLKPLVERDADFAVEKTDTVSERAAEVPWRDHVYAEFGITGRIIRSQRFKYIMQYAFSGEQDQPFVKVSDGLASPFIPGHGKAFQADPVRLLFDMKSDPWETQNLAEDPNYHDVLAEHEAFLLDWEAKLIPGVHFDRN